MCIHGEVPLNLAFVRISKANARRYTPTKNSKAIPLQSFPPFPKKKKCIFAIISSFNHWRILISHHNAALSNKYHNPLSSGSMRQTGRHRRIVACLHQYQHFMIPFYMCQVILVCDCQLDIYGFLARISQLSVQPYELSGVFALAVSYQRIMLAVKLP